MVFKLYLVFCGNGGKTKEWHFGLSRVERFMDRGSVNNLEDKITRNTKVDLIPLDY